MSSLNQVNLIGRMGKDPELRHMPNGDAVVNISLATSESWKDKTTGEKKEATEWHRCVAYGKLAEVVGQYAKKGSLLYVGGKLKTRKWQDKDGRDVYMTEIVFDQMRLLGGKTDEGGSASRPPPQGSAQRQAAAPAPAASGGFDDDIPF